MSNIVRIETNARASRAVVHNGIVYLCGMTAEDRSQDIRGQTIQVLARIEKYLALAGTNKRHLLTAQIWIRDIVHDFALMNEIWDAWTESGAPPTRATAQCQMSSPDVLVEIIVTAALPQHE
ncbi:MAG TPA: RidA family protein [Steroidobacter sp.]|uniref:RidA family protein n=1 Tax=Steroidobacter sp. TaxID=1978227 RepID=UPI002ED9F886